MTSKSITNRARTDWNDKLKDMMRHFFDLLLLSLGVLQADMIRADKRRLATLTFSVS